MKRVFRCKIRMPSGYESTVYVTGTTAAQVRAKLIRNGHKPADVLSTTAIHDASEDAPGRIYGVVESA